MTDDNGEAGGEEVIICAGPPMCDLEGNAAVQNQIDGCPICRREVLQSDGTWKSYQKASN